MVCILRIIALSCLSVNSHLVPVKWRLSGTRHRPENSVYSYVRDRPNFQRGLILGALLIVVVCVSARFSVNMAKAKCWSIAIIGDSTWHDHSLKGVSNFGLANGQADFGKPFRAGKRILISDALMDDDWANSFIPLLKRQRIRQGTYREWWLFPGREHRPIVVGSAFRTIVEVRNGFRFRRAEGIGSALKLHRGNMAKLGPYHFNMFGYRSIGVLFRTKPPSYGDHQGSIRAYSGVGLRPSGFGGNLGGVGRAFHLAGLITSESSISDQDDYSRKLDWLFPGFFFRKLISLVSILACTILMILCVGVGLSIINGEVPRQPNADAAWLALWLGITILGAGQCFAFLAFYLASFWF